MPRSCLAIVVDNVLVSTSKYFFILSDSVNDDFDETVTSIINSKFKDKVIFGKNVLIGENVSIGVNCKIV